MIAKKIIKANTFRTQEFDSVMYGYFCIGFRDFIVFNKKLIYFTSFFFFFSPNDFKENDRTIKNHFDNVYNKIARKYYIQKMKENERTTNNHFEHV